MIMRDLEPHSHGIGERSQHVLHAGLVGDHNHCNRKSAHLVSNVDIAGLGDTVEGRVDLRCISPSAASTAHAAGPAHSHGWSTAHRSEPHWLARAATHWTAASCLALLLTRADLRHLQLAISHAMPS